MSEMMTDERLADIESLAEVVANAGMGWLVHAQTLAKKALPELLAEVRRLRATGWRPASEPPTEPGEYLTWMSHMEPPAQTAYWTGWSWVWNHDEIYRGDDVDGVSHWMPLPQPPAGVSR